MKVQHAALGALLASGLAASTPIVSTPAARADQTMNGMDGMTTTTVTTSQSTTTSSSAKRAARKQLPAGRSLSMNGAVGLPLNPTAQLPDRCRTPLQLDYYDLGDVDTSGVDRSSFSFYGVHAASRIGRSPLEINAGLEALDVHDVDDLSSNSADRSGAAFGAKYQFFQNRAGDTALAVGAGYSRVLEKNFYAYLVGTHAFAVGRNHAPILAHLGVRYDRFNPNDLADFLDDSHRVSAYGGLEVPLDKRGQFTAVGELQSKNNDYHHSFFDDVHSGEAKAPYSLGLRFNTRDERFSAMAGIQRRGYPGLTNQSGFFANVGYAFGHCDTPKPPCLTISAPVDFEACENEDVAAKVKMLRPEYSGGVAPYSWDAARSDGRNWNDPYSAGQTTIEWRVTDSAGDTVTAKSNVTVVGIAINGLEKRPYTVKYDQNLLILDRDELIHATTGFPNSRLTYALKLDGRDVNVNGVTLDRRSADVDGIKFDTRNIDEKTPQNFVLDWTIGLEGADCPSRTFQQIITIEKLPKPIVKLLAFDAVTCAHDGEDMAHVTIKPAVANPPEIPVTATRSDGAQNLSDPYPVGVTTIHWTATVNGKEYSIDSTVTVYKIEIGQPLNLTYLLDWPARTYAYTPVAPTTTWVSPEGREALTPHAFLKDGTEVEAGAPHDFPLGTTVLTWKASRTMGDHTCEETVSQIINVKRSVAEIICPQDFVAWTCEGRRVGADLQQPAAKDGRPLNITVNRSDDADGSRGLKWNSDFPVGATILKWYVVDPNVPGGMPHECKTVVRVKSARLWWSRVPNNITHTVFECQKLQLSPEEIGMPVATSNYPHDLTRVTQIVGMANGQNVENGYSFGHGTTTVHWTATNEFGCSIEWNQKIIVLCKPCHGMPMSHVAHRHQAQTFRHFSSDDK